MRAPGIQMATWSHRLSAASTSVVFGNVHTLDISSDDFSTGSARAMGRSELCIMHSLNQDREGSLLKRSSYYGLALSPGSCGIAVNAKSGDSRGGTFVILSYMDVFPR
ncbi:hypothetical protein BJY01DRAFT_55915 [Aspergillus pseudoustus]|uniref:Uncharacterized protein n=1 Tax=Aspergillus pseudoustus TaxID=1810923 RepID=A0ABR4J8T7_9EURO